MDKELQTLIDAPLADPLKMYLPKGKAKAKHASRKVVTQDLDPRRLNKRQLDERKADAKAEMLGKILDHYATVWTPFERIADHTGLSLEQSPDCHDPKRARGMTWKAGGAKSDKSELAVQTLFRSRARFVCPKVKIVAIPNGGKRTVGAARKAKLEGMSSGMPDVLVMWSAGSAPENVVPHIAFVEFKAGGGGTVSENQTYWLDWLDSNGFPCLVTRDADHALEWLREQGAPFVGKITA